MNKPSDMSFDHPAQSLALTVNGQAVSIPVARAAQRLTEVTGVGIEPATYNYTPSRNTVDVLGEYTIWRRIAVFGNLRNVGDVPNNGTTVGPTTPYHARLRTSQRYGSLWTFGLKGTY